MRSLAAPTPQTIAARHLPMRSALPATVLVKVMVTLSSAPAAGAAGALENVTVPAARSATQPAVSAAPFTSTASTPSSSA